MINKALRSFLKLESSSGILLIFATIFALIAANSGLTDLYQSLLGTKFEIRLGTFSLGKPLLLWINDGLMAVFFFLVGLELKREAMEGELSDPKQIALPLICAVFGILVPALTYLLFNYNDADAVRGWAIPTATDIAFALGILALLGPKVPNSLKIFLMTLAIIDDLIAIIIIAIFYSGDISQLSLAVSLVCIFILGILNKTGVVKTAPYILVGLVLWTSVLKSGVHATLAGVILAFFVPMRGKNPEDASPVKHLEHDLHPWVAYMILPIFAFANAGVSFDGMSLQSILEPVPLGIALGLFIGKPVGVILGAVLTRTLGVSKLPEGANWLQLTGVAILCGVGFTMSLFIGSLAFEGGGADHMAADRIGILVGSGLSAVFGAFVVWLSIRKSSLPQTD